ncbi:hypothetical protein CsSME_00035058 [Camellia sinensis var. sinensis]
MMRCSPTHLGSLPPKQAATCSSRKNNSAAATAKAKQLCTMLADANLKQQSKTAQWSLAERKFKRECTLIVRSVELVQNHVLLGSNAIYLTHPKCNGELNNTQENGHNNILSSKGLSTGMMFEPACDYLKKMDNSWEFTNPQFVINNFKKHFNGFNEGLIESERLNKLPSSLVNNWSFAPPDSEINNNLNPTTFSGRINMNSGSYLCYGQEMKVKDEHREIEYQLGLYNSILGDSNKYYYGLPDVPCNGTRSFGDVMSSNSFLGKPIGIASEGKKKRSKDNSETPTKKPKHDTSSALLSSKMQVTKVKLGDKITALQQIVSPFEKTDTASVLGEAIGYIKFLQEQVQLLSNLYMKGPAHVDPRGCPEKFESGRGRARPIDNVNIHIDMLTFTLIRV